jgi:hypothetical protein
LSQAVHDHGVAVEIVVVGPSLMTTFPPAAIGVEVRLQGVDGDGGDKSYDGAERSSVMTTSYETDDRIGVDWNFVRTVLSSVESKSGGVAFWDPRDELEKEISLSLGRVYSTEREGGDDADVEAKARLGVKRLGQKIPRGRIAKITRRDVLFKVLADFLGQIKNTLCDKSQDGAFGAAVGVLATALVTQIGLSEVVAGGTATLMIIWLITASKRAVCRLTAKQILALLKGNA